MDADRFEIPRWRCFELLRSQDVGRLCVIDNGYPIALPVNYRFDADNDDAKIVIRLAANSLLGRYDGLTSLEVDHIDLAGGNAWSVLVRGKTHRVFGAHQLKDPQPLLSGRESWLTIQPSGVSGRDFILHNSAEGNDIAWEATEPPSPG